MSTPALCANVDAQDDAIHFPAADPKDGLQGPLLRCLLTRMHKKIQESSLLQMQEMGL